MAAKTPAARNPGIPNGGLFSRLPKRFAGGEKAFAAAARPRRAKMRGHGRMPAKARPIKAKAGSMTGRFFHDALHAFIDLAAPGRCPLCGAFLPPGGRGRVRFCAACRNDMPPLPPDHCTICALPFASPAAGRHACGACLSRRPHFERAVAAGIHARLLATAVHRFKYGGRTELAGPLAALMRDRLAPPFVPAEADLVLPVPLHPRRLRQRGFNQALLLARALFPGNRKSIRADILMRTRDTAHQAGLGRKARRLNVHRAFELRAPGAVKGLAVLLVDDVLTTGATVRECARVLKKAGAQTVLVLALARAAPRDVPIPGDQDRALPSPPPVI